MIAAMAAPVIIGSQVARILKSGLTLINRISTFTNNFPPKTQKIISKVLKRERVFQ